MREESPRRRSLVRQVYTFRADEQAVHPTARLVFFTDAILAIAATVLVLDLSVRPEREGGGLAHQITLDRADLLSVLLGFLWIIGGWVLSHRFLRQLRGADHYLTLLTVASTLSLTLIPFATLLLANGYGHGDFWVGVEAVSSAVLVGTVLSALATEYAHRRGLVLGSPNPQDRRAARTIWYAVVALVVLAVVLAPVVPWLALAIVVLTRISALLPLASDRAGYAGAEPPAAAGPSDGR